MSRRDEVLVKHREAIREAARRNKARSIALVGSTARREDADGSDFDFLVVLEEDADLFDMAGLQVDLRELPRPRCRRCRLLSDQGEPLWDA